MHSACLVHLIILVLRHNFSLYLCRSNTQLSPGNRKLCKGIIVLSTKHNKQGELRTFVAWYASSVKVTVLVSMCSSSADPYVSPILLTNLKNNQKNIEVFHSGSTDKK